MIATRWNPLGKSGVKPYAYEVEYLQSDVKSYIDTRITPSITGRSYLKFRSVNTSGQCPWGATNFTEISGYGRYFSSTGIEFFAPSPVDEIIEVVVDGESKTVTRNGVDYTSSSYFTTAVPEGSTCWLFGRGDTKNTGRVAIYRATFTNDGVCVGDFIPVVDYDGIACMYDKVTKQLFYNQGTGAFIPGPRVGPIGNVSAKDYIQYGLIHLWDGIENVGFNLHDGGATVWKDLVGGFDLPLNPTATWAKDGTVNTKGYHAGLYGAENALPLADQKTIECVFVWHGGYDDSRNVAAIYTSGDTYAGKLVFLNGSDKSLSASRSSAKQSFSTDRVTLNMPHSISAVYSGTSLYTYRFSLDGATDTYTTSTNRDAEIGTFIGGRCWEGATPFYGLVGKMCCVRLYNRELSTSEIEYNLAIDKERFGIE